jgi:uncharacterized protein (TIGR03083 family)
MSTIDDQVTAYGASRARIDALVRDLDDDRLVTVVPCCPAWTVKDLVGHVTGVLEDRNEKRLPTGGFEGWTDAQVARHRDEPIAVVLDRWHALAVTPDDAVPSMAALSFDAVSHEHDLCQALGVTGHRESHSVRVGSDRARERMGSLLSQSDAPGVDLSVEDEEILLEGGATPIGLKTTHFELMRLVTGRLSRRQATALAWDGDPNPVLDVLWADGFFTPQPVDVVLA